MGPGPAAGSIARLDALASRPGCQLTYSVGWDLGGRERDAIRLVPEEAWQIAIDHRGAQRAGTWWSQVRDVKITAFVTEYLLPLLICPCCGKTGAAQAPEWAHPGSVSYGPGVNTAAVLLSSYGNVPTERTANLIQILLGSGPGAGGHAIGLVITHHRLPNPPASLRSVYQDRALIQRTTGIWLSHAQPAW